jgi:hypothetical protein
MPEDDHPHGPSFADRLDELFRTVLNPATGKPYSVRHVAAQLTASGCMMSHTHLYDLRMGRATDPRRSEMEAIAAFFGKQLDYFTVTDIQQRLLEALADPAIKQVALRMVDAELSSEGAAAVLAMIEHVRLLEHAARRRRDDDSGGAPAERG